MPMWCVPFVAGFVVRSSGGLGALRSLLSLLADLGDGLLALGLKLLAQRLELFRRPLLLRLTLFLPTVVAKDNADELLGESDRLVHNASQLVDVDSTDLHHRSLSFGGSDWVPACKSKQTRHAHSRGGTHRFRALKVCNELAHPLF